MSFYIIVSKKRLNCQKFDFWTLYRFFLLLFLWKHEHIIFEFRWNFCWKLKSNLCPLLVQCDIGRLEKRWVRINGARCKSGGLDQSVAPPLSLPDVSQHDTGSVSPASREAVLQVRDRGELPKPKRRDEGPVLRRGRELRNGPRDNALGWVRKLSGLILCRRARSERQSLKPDRQHHRRRAV